MNDRPKHLHFVLSDNDATTPCGLGTSGMGSFLYSAHVTCRAEYANVYLRELLNVEICQACNLLTLVQDA
jgi:hypothetical protein